MRPFLLLFAAAATSTSVQPCQGNGITINSAEAPSNNPRPKVTFAIVGDLDCNAMILGFGQSVLTAPVGPSWGNCNTETSLNHLDGCASSLLLTTLLGA